MDRMKTNIRLFYAIALLQGMVFYGPIATLYRQARGLSVFDITLIESISLIVMIVLEVPWGCITDKIGYKNTLILCNLLFFISKIVFWKANGFPLFLLERLMLSVILSGLSGCDSAFLYLCAGEKESQRVFGIYDAMGTAGLIFASMLFSLVVRNDYSLSAALTIVSYSLAAVLTLFLTEVKSDMPEYADPKARLKEILLSVTESKKFLLFLIAAALIAESSQTITVFLNQLQYLASGIPSRHMGYIYILVTVSGLLSAYSSKFTAWLGEALTAKLLFLLAGMACLFMTLFTNPVISVLGIIILRISSSVFIPLSRSIQNRQVNVSCRATILSVYSVSMNIMGTGTNLVFGKLADIGIHFAMAAGTLFCFAGLILYSLWEKVSAADQC